MTDTGWPYAAKVRLYVDRPLGAVEEVVLDGGQHHYVTNVMRLKVGDAVLVFNGQDGEWLAKIDDARKKSCRLELLEQTRQQDRVPDIWLLFAPVKRLRQDYLVQKATELGVAALQPVHTQRTEVSRVKEDRLLANVIEAAEQTGRLTLPEVKPLVKLSALLDAWDSSRKLIFCDEAGDAKPIAAALASEASKQSWAIIIGPEGGFDPAERILLRKQSYVVPVSLGPRVMRADTAAIAALTLWQSVLGDLG